MYRHNSAVGGCLCNFWFCCFSGADLAQMTAGMFWSQGFHCCLSCVETFLFTWDLFIHMSDTDLCDQLCLSRQLAEGWTCKHFKYVVSCLQCLYYRHHWLSPFHTTFGDLSLGWGSWSVASKTFWVRTLAYFSTSWDEIWYSVRGAE